MDECRTCQRPRKPGAKFCASCGTPFPSAEPGIDLGPADSAGTTPAGDRTTGPSGVSTATVREPGSGPIQQMTLSQAYGADQSTPDGGTPGPHILATNGDRIDLFPGEQALHQASFTPSLIAPHIRSTIICTNLRVITHHPAVLFGFFPVGYSVAQAPHSRIDYIASGSRIRGPRVMLGAFAVVISLFLLLSGGLAEFGGVELLMALFLAGVGVVLIVTARVIGVFVTAGDGVLGAVGRGHELDAMRQTADRMTRLLLASEQPRTPLT